MGWVEIAQNLGVSFACLVALAYAVWKALRWIGEHILKPIADRHIAFVDRVSDNMDRQTLAMESLGKAILNLGTSREEELLRLDHITDRLGEIATGLGEVKSLIVKTDSVQIVTHSKGDRDDPGRR